MKAVCWNGSGDVAANLWRIGFRNRLALGDGAGSHTPFLAEAAAGSHSSGRQSRKRPRVDIEPVAQLVNRAQRVGGPEEP